MNQLAPSERSPRHRDAVTAIGVFGRTLTRAQAIETEEGQLLLAQARSEGAPVHCLCRGEQNPLPLYLRRLGEHIIVCRMPTSGLAHHPECVFYGETEHVDLDRKLSAVVERPDGKLDVRLALPAAPRGQVTNIGRRSGVPTSRAAARESLELRGLLNLLWEQAHLNRWYPAMQGKRHWSKVAYFLGRAAEQIYVDGVSFADRVIRLDPYGNKAASRVASLADLRQSSRAETCDLLFVIGAVANKHWKGGADELVLSGLSEPIKVDERHRKNMESAFEAARARASGVRNSWLIALLALRCTEDGSMRACAGAWMSVTSAFLPFARIEEASLLEHLVARDRSIWVGLRHAEDSNRIACTDTEERFTLLNIIAAGQADETGPGAWRWVVDRGDIPDLPAKRTP